MIYFDNAAAEFTPIEVLDYFALTGREVNGNQESGHIIGYELRKKLAAAGEDLSSTLLLNDMSVAWGNCGTEIFNMFSRLKRFASGNIVCSYFEHPALLAALARTGLELRYMPTCRDGVDWTRAAELIDRNTRLVALTHVQSELGLICDVAAVRAIVNECNSCAWLLADTIQSACKLPLPAEADFITVSGHKIGAPGGAALLYRKSLKLEKEFSAMRHQTYLVGRPEVLQILTLAYAARMAAAKMPESLAEVTQINKFLRDEICCSEIVPTFPAARCSPYILHVTLSGRQGAIMVRMLSKHGICVSSGSACQAESNTASTALVMLGFDRNAAFSGMRFSFSGKNSMQEAKSVRDVFSRIWMEY